MSDIDYMMEKCETALGCARLGGRADVVSAWLELDHVWLRVARKMPAKFRREYETIAAVFHSQDTLGPSFGGEHLGTYRMSIEVLTDEQFELFRDRLIDFLGALIGFGEKGTAGA